MARLDMKTQIIIDDIGGNSGGSGNNNIRACLSDLSDVFSDIRKTALELNGVWEDEAQRIFMDSLTKKTERINQYIHEMTLFMGDIITSVNKIADWDSVLYTKLSDPYLKG